MATTKEYKDLILNQLNLSNKITCKPMMGEYLLYYNKTLFGGIYDNKLLVKIVENNKKYSLQEFIPYPNAKAMYIITDINNQKLLKKIIIDTYENLCNKK